MPKYYIKEFQHSVNVTCVKRVIDKKQYLEIFHGFLNYEKII